MVWEILPKSLLIALVVQLLSQTVKFVSNSIRLRKWSWKYLMTFGGMPSAHSAFVTALAASIGFLNGWNSELFAVSAVFGGIVIFDAYKLRGNVQKQAIVVNKLQDRLLEGHERISINEMVGHNLKEIAAGIVFAIVLSIPLAWWAKSI